ncbi:spore germination protein [Rossellomorea sp. BNER]|uniref:spore germination protein n=1 Tax=Rossellomorea sp. BNER TaxID=2962031 RepID=UPI003AF2901A|nr:spore germination protein [Rossellomorea sp. BNER]
MLKRFFLKDEVDIETNQTSDEEAINNEKRFFPSYEHICSQFEECSDLTKRTYPSLNLHILYFDHLIDQQKLEWEVLSKLNQNNIDSVKDMLSSSNYTRSDDSKVVVKSILKGKVILFFQGETYIVGAGGSEGRAVSHSETETVINGAHDSFVESAYTNLSLIRKKVKSSHLKCIKISVGEISKTEVYILYIEDIANPELLKHLMNRIEDIEINAVNDLNMLVQLIDEFPKSPFPQYYTSERPDVAAAKLFDGKIVGLMDQSPYIFSAPTNFFDFFQSNDDLSQRWMIGTAIRILRLIALFITVSFTAYYVSVTTFHYEMIPEALLNNLIESRSKVPFPPLIEALLMEFTIELLREAGARLPTKIGQTIGIVGGIVIGQASVEAGITSNILIIAVAVSAISSFVIPSYIMSASLRIVRFAFIILAGLWGNIGLIFGVSILVIHLTGLTNLKTPYLFPVSPTYPSDLKDTIIRAPFSWIKGRPHNTLTNNLRKNKMKN